MSSNTITTIVAMVESLPDTAQLQVAEHLRHYIQDLQDEARWDHLFETTQPQLIAAARRAKREIAEGKAVPLNEFFGISRGKVTRKNNLPSSYGTQSVPGCIPTQERGNDA